MSEAVAYVTTDENGQLILHDPMAQSLIEVISYHQRQAAKEFCEKIYEDAIERIAYFHQRFEQGIYKKDNYCIVLIQVDDPYGGPISELLMPGFDWQPIRDQGLKPIARGVAERKFMHDVLALFNQNAATEFDSTELAVVVVAAENVQIYAI